VKKREINKVINPPRIDKDENNAGSKVSTNSKELITKRKH
jgi:hypothetical protein